MITIIIGLHVLIILSLMMQNFFSSPVKKKSLLVKTIAYKPRGEIKFITPQTTSNTKPTAKKNADKKIESVSLKKEPFKKNKITYSAKAIKKIEKKSLPKVTDPPKKLPLPKDLADEITTSIAKLEKYDAPEKEKNSKQELYIPSSLRNLNLNISLSENNDANEEKDSMSLSYQERLIAELQEKLELPEFGEVKVSFILSSDGKISELIILQSKSIKNQEYLKNTLPNLAFTWFNQFSRKPQSFIIVFKNNSKK